MSKHISTKELTTLKKARSHIGKIIEMMESDEYCIDIIQQLNAVEGYIKSVKKDRLRSHLESCFLDGMSDGGKTRQEYIDEIIRILKISK